MRTIGNSFGSLAIIGGLIASLNFVHGQTTTKAAQAVSAEDMAVMLQAVEATTPQAAESVPKSGTFYSAQFPNWPPLPCNINNVPVWNLGDGVFLLSDLDVNYSQRPMVSSMMAGNMMAMSAPMPGDGGDSGTNTFTFNGSSYMLPDYGTNLWIANFALSSGNATGIISNSPADVQLELQYTTDLLQPWQSAGWFVYGSELTNWTPFSVPTISSSNLFLRVRSWADDGSGLPIWWQLQYFGTTGIDPNADPMGDGWSNIQKYQNGMNPNIFYTPPTPQGLTATFNADSTATVTWKPSPGPVTGYTVQRDYYTFNVPPYDASQTFNPSASTVSLQDTTSFNTPYYLGGGWGLAVHVSYKIKAHYAGGDSAWSDTVWIEPGSPAITLVPGPQSSVYLAAPNLPTGTTALRLTRLDGWMEDEFGDSPANVVSFDIPVSTGTNGLYLIPAEWTTSPTDAYGYAFYSWSGQPIDANGNGTGQATELNWGYYSPVAGDLIDWIVPPYFDGRTQLKQNLIFLLRAATVNHPFYYNGLSADRYGYFGYAYTVTNPATYAYSGFNNPVLGSDGYVYNGFDVFSSFQNNYTYRNFVFSPADLNGYHAPFSYESGHIMTGAGGNYEDSGYYGSYYYAGGMELYAPPTYQFSPPTTSGTAISAVLATNQTQRLCSYPLDSPEMYYDGQNMVSYGYLEEIGVTPSVDTDWNTYYNTFETMAGNARNIYGLSFLSAEIAYGNTDGTAIETNILSAGGQLENVDGYFYPETAQPQFQTVEYDFWNQSPLPGSANFLANQPSDLLIASVGNTIGINGFAKLAILNGYSGVYGYLGQYFDQAYQINTNGVVTTNTTGVLSSYGQFFATQPGLAALVTMPDVDTGERGTGTVYSYSVAIDRNQGSNMDLSFNGADATSQANPATVWVNDNYDRGHTVDGSDFEQDDLGPVDIGNGHLVPDCQYTANGLPAIPCTRDLEDYFRLWTPGVAALMKVLPANYTVQLTLSGNGQIRIFQAVEPNGGTNYLFDETTASNQVANSASLYVGLLTSSSPIILPIQTNFNEHFIFCGVTNGSAQVDLQILDGNQNVVADAPAYLQINEIKQMYERWTVGDDLNKSPASVAIKATDGLQTNPPASAFQYALPQNSSTPYILFVHGWNMQTWEKDRYAEAAYKRLYWQGYKGRFGSFRWPTGNGFSGKISVLTDARNYDNSESNAWASATGLTNLLTQLNAEYPGKVYLMAHSMGNVVAGEALRKAGSQLVNAYIAMQGAVPAHCYDASTANRSSSGPPDCYAAYWTNGAPCYFNGTAGAGSYINFYNTNDWALAYWNTDQDPYKPDNSGVPFPGYYYNTPSGTHPSGFYKIIGSTDYDLYFPANTYEIFAYADRAWSYALGAEAGITTFTRKVDLHSVWPSVDTHPGHDYSAHVWHSAEFRSDYPSRVNNWNAILGGNGFNLK